MIDDLARRLALKDARELASSAYWRLVDADRRPLTPEDLDQLRDGLSRLQVMLVDELEDNPRSRLLALGRAIAYEQRQEEATGK